MADSFQNALKTLVSLGAERVLVLEGPSPFKLRAAHGILDQQHWSEQVSMGLLESTIKEGAPLFLPDVQASPQGERWSLLLNSVRSVLCVPFWTPSSRIAGILYADTCSAAGLFSRKAIDAVQICARELEASLYGGRPVSKADAPIKVAPRGALGLRQVVAAASQEPPKPVASEAAYKTPSGQSVTIFYRSMAAMVAAGLPLSRSLEVLAHHESDKGLRGALGQVCSKVHSGSPLSAAMTHHPRVFSALYVQMVRVGEKSGSLHTVLLQLADHREKSQQTELKLRQALTYPALILLLCLAVLIFAPPYLLQGQFTMIRASGQVPPWPTQILMLLSDLVRSPLALLILTGSAALGLAALRRFTSYAQWLSLAWRMPGLKLALVNLTAARFAGTLGLAYRVGIPVTEAIRLAVRSTQNPLLESYEQSMVDALVGGAPLARSLSECPYFPTMFLRMLSAGEEVGKVDEMMAWVASFYDLELSSSLERLLVLVEPILLLGMGMIVAFVLVATLLPMVNVLQAL